MLKIIRSSLIIILILLLFKIFVYFDYKAHNYIIDNIYLNDIVTNKLNYIGYIEIDRINIKREIVVGITDMNLMSHVALDVKSKNLESNNIILAGHAIKNIFGNLKYVKLNDNIKIVSSNTIYNYYVTSIDIVKKEDIEVIDDSDLILITCYDFNNRLIVKAKRIKKAL